MKDLLYIDGQLVDLGDGVNITLDYKSNMLTDLSKIVGNNSYTINLPKTMKNLNIIGCADMAGVVSSFPRTYHEARYFRNGVELFKDGKAVLMGVGDTIEIVLLWGLSSGVYKLVELDKNLNEFTGVDDYVMWEATNSKSAFDGRTKVVNMDVQYGLKSGETLVAIHPSVRSSYIFGLIESNFGVSFDLPHERKGFVNSLMIPLLTRNGGFANSSRSVGIVSYSELSQNYVLQKIGDEFDSNFLYSPPVDWGTTDFVGFKVLSAGKLKIQITFKSSIADKAIYYGAGNIPSEWGVKYLSYYISNGEYVYDSVFTIDVAEGDGFGIEMVGVVSTGFNGALMRVELTPSTIEIGERFPIVENLPNISCVEYVKAIAAIGGMFCVPSDDGAIKFITFESLADRSNAVDWTDKLIVKDATNKPRSISYSLNDFARKNNMLWADDDSVGITTANGAILVDDVTLDLERDAVELPFAASDTRGGKAMIRLYEYDDDGKPELQSVEPRILIEKDVDGYSTGTFDGLHWNTLIGEYYNTYQNAVKSPVVVSELVRLDELSLRDLDVAKPVYLRQYGRYYAIVELKAPSNGVCECKLLQLD